MLAVPGPHRASCGAVSRAEHSRAAWAQGCQLAFLTSSLPSQASGDTPTTPKHPKDSRENFFPAAVAPVAPDPVLSDAVQRPSDAHTKPRPALAATTAVIACPPSASASTPDPPKDPGPPRPHRPEATPSMASFGPGESHPSPGVMRPPCPAVPEPSQALATSKSSLCGEGRQEGGRGAFQLRWSVPQGQAAAGPLANHRQRR